MSTRENTSPSRDVYQKVTDAIVQAIQQGAGQYRMPWVVRQDRGRKENGRPPRLGGGSDS